MEEVGREVRGEELLMFLASGATGGDVCALPALSVYSACFGLVSAHRLMSRPAALRTIDSIRCRALDRLGLFLAVRNFHLVHWPR